MLMPRDGDENFVLLGSTWFIPGLIFPFLTTNYKNSKRSKIIMHIIIAFLIYFAVFALYLQADRTNQLLEIGGFLGSLFYQLLTKYIFKTSSSYKLIFLIALLSGIAFLPTYYIYRSFPVIGFDLLVWTIFNGIVANKSTAANSR